ncbi:alpha/beta fold hydrolase [Dermatobacter hominis]|uniref:alpha/beta fold hydrolase n=1 Tax=Dermatobacter hominis TaxID=2884263 RepID=UPI0035AB8C1D
MFVLVHGAWHGSWCWSRLQASLSAAGAVSTAVDLPGRAGDPTPLDGLDLDAYAERVAAVVTSVDEPVVLVGHSMGGATISQVAERVPERIEALVYVCALLQPLGRLARRPARAGPGQRAAGRGRARRRRPLDLDPTRRRGRSLLRRLRRRGPGLGRRAAVRRAHRSGHRHHPHHPRAVGLGAAGLRAL